MADATVAQVGLGARIRVRRCTRDGAAGADGAAQAVPIPFGDVCFQIALPFVGGPVCIPLSKPAKAVPATAAADAHGGAL